MWERKKKEKTQTPTNPIEKIIVQELKDKNAPKPKYEVVANKRSIDTYENETIIYMKRGKVKKYISITIVEPPYIMNTEERDLVTGGLYSLYTERTQIKVTLRTCDLVHQSSQRLYRDDTFTSFQVGEDTVSVRTEDINRMVQKPSRVIKTTIFDYDSLEPIIDAFSPKVK